MNIYELSVRNGETIFVHTHSFNVKEDIIMKFQKKIPKYFTLLKCIEYNKGRSSIDTQEFSMHT